MFLHSTACSSTPSRSSSHGQTTSMIHREEHSVSWARCTKLVASCPFCLCESLILQPAPAHDHDPCVSNQCRPLIADNFGRKLPIAIGCAIMIVGSFLQGFASNMGIFMGGRVLLGFGNSLAQISSPMLLTEICHPQHRGRLTAVYNCLWNAGAIGACLLDVLYLLMSDSTNRFIQLKHGSRSVRTTWVTSGHGVFPESSRRPPP